MLNLVSKTPKEWVTTVEAGLEQVLIDHAHCEKKAAGAAFKLIFTHTEKIEFVDPLSEIAIEELEHFRMVLQLIKDRGFRFKRQKPSSYGKRLAELIRKDEPGRTVDRCLIAALIEARSCERFAVLRDHLQDQELAIFFGELFESEARHHSTYVQFAKQFGSNEKVEQRLEELAIQEAEIIAIGDPFPRIHS